MQQTIFLLGCFNMNWNMIFLLTFFPSFNLLFSYHFMIYILNWIFHWTCARLWLRRLQVLVCLSVGLPEVRGGTGVSGRAAIFCPTLRYKCNFYWGTPEVDLCVLPLNPPPPHTCFSHHFSPPLQPSTPTTQPQAKDNLICRILKMIY